MHCCRYILAFNIPGVGEKLLLSGSMTQGLLSDEAMAVEGSMVQELGLMEALQKPGAATAALNWYRCVTPLRKKANFPVHHQAFVLKWVSEQALQQYRVS